MNSEHSEGGSNEVNSGDNVGDEEEHSSSNQFYVSSLGMATNASNVKNEEQKGLKLGEEAALKEWRKVDVLKLGDLWKTSNVVENKKSERSQHAAAAIEMEAVDCEEPEVISRDVFYSKSCDLVGNNKKHHYTVEEPIESIEVTTDPGLPNLREFFGWGGEIEKGNNHGFDLNANVANEDVDCELSLSTFNPTCSPKSNVVSASRKPIHPLYFESELGLRSSAAASPKYAMDNDENMMSDWKQREEFAEIDLNLTMNPAFARKQHVSEREEKIQLGLSLMKEEEHTPLLLQLSSSVQPAMRNFDLNDDPCMFDAHPVLNLMDSRLMIDKRDELSTQTFIPGIEEMTPHHGVNSGMMQMENQRKKDVTMFNFMMPENRDFLGGEERKTMKRKEPDSGWDWEPYGHGSGFNNLRLKL